MNKLKIVAILLAFVVFLFAGCSLATPTTPKEYISSAQTIGVKVGEQFTITLESNPTTGYKWESNFDQNLLNLVKSEYKADPQAQGRVGAGGKEQFIFEGLKAGEAQIKMTYKRAWEQQADKTDTFTVLIK